MALYVRVPAFLLLASFIVGAFSYEDVDVVIYVGVGVRVSRDAVVVGV